MCGVDLSRCKRMHSCSRQQTPVCCCPGCCSDAITSALCACCVFLLSRHAETVTAKMRLHRALLAAFLLASCLSIKPACAYRPILQAPAEPAPADPTNTAPLPEDEEQATAVLPVAPPADDATVTPTTVDAPPDTSVVPAVAAVLPLPPTPVGPPAPDLSYFERGPHGYIRCVRACMHACVTHCAAPCDRVAAPQHSWTH